jgi:hypothetical protein
VKLRCSRRHRLPRVDDDRQFLEVDVDRLECVIRLVDAFRDDDRDRISHLTHFA